MNKLTLPLFLLYVFLIITATCFAYTSCGPTCYKCVSRADCQSAIDAASDGYTIILIQSDSSWDTTLSISNKAIHFKGSSKSITISGTAKPYISINKDDTGSVEVSDLTLTSSDGFCIEIGVDYVTDRPIILHDLVFNISEAGDAIFWQSINGLIFNCTFNGTYDEDGIQIRNGDGSNSWSSTDTIGTNDSNGKHNLYIEGNIFNNLANQCIDADEGARVVVRFNTFNGSSFNSHGKATSTNGARHYEIYNNDFIFPASEPNINWFIWLRGGTGVVFNNDIDDINSQEWGNKSEVKFSIRAADDLCSCNSYPCSHQLGRNYNGSSEILDPIYFWNNDTIHEWHDSNWTWGGTCGNTWSDFFQINRDYYRNTQKSGYSPYTCPHPLTGLGGECDYSIAGVDGYNKIWQTLKGMTISGGISTQ